MKEGFSGTVGLFLLEEQLNTNLFSQRAPSHCHYCQMTSTKVRGRRRTFSFIRSQHELFCCGDSFQDAQFSNLCSGQVGSPYSRWLHASWCDGGSLACFIESVSDPAWVCEEATLCNNRAHRQTPGHHFKTLESIVSVGLQGATSVLPRMCPSRSGVVSMRDHASLQNKSSLLAFVYDSVNLLYQSHAVLYCKELSQSLWIHQTK